MSKSKHNGKFWLLHRDPWGLVCSASTYAIAIVVSLLVNTLILLPHLDSAGSLLHAITYNYVVLMMLISHLRCMLTNPGTARDYLDKDLIRAMRQEFARTNADMPSRDVGAWPPGQQKWWCTKCDTFRPKHTHHCSTCGCCVLEMDHHCPWVNNCVGWRNHKYFLLFLAYSWVALLWSGTLIAYGMRSLHDLSVTVGARLDGVDVGAMKIQTDIGVQSPKLWVRRFLADNWTLHTSLGLQVLCLLVCVVCILLLIFVSFMCCDQCEYMDTGFGVIDKKLAHQGTAPRLLKPRAPGSGCWSWRKLPQVMGGPCGLTWLFPVAPGARDLALVPVDEFVSSVYGRLCRTENASAFACDNARMGKNEPHVEAASRVPDARCSMATVALERQPASVVQQESPRSASLPILIGGCLPQDGRSRGGSAKKRQRAGLLKRSHSAPSLTRTSPGFVEKCDLVLRPVYLQPR